MFVCRREASQEEVELAEMYAKQVNPPQSSGEQDGGNTRREKNSKKKR